MAQKLTTAVFAACGLLFAAGEECPAELSAFFEMAGDQEIYVYSDCDAGWENAYFQSEFNGTDGTEYALFASWSGYEEACQYQNATPTLHVELWNYTQEYEAYWTNCSDGGCEKFGCNRQCDKWGYCTSYADGGCPVMTSELEGVFAHEVVHECEGNITWEHWCPAKISQLLHLTDIWNMEIHQSCEDEEEQAYVIVGAGTGEDARVWIGQWLNYAAECSGSAEPVLSVVQYKSSEASLISDSQCSTDDDCTHVHDCNPPCFDGYCYPWVEQCAMADGRFEMQISFEDVEYFCDPYREDFFADDDEDYEDGSCVMVPPDKAMTFKLRPCGYA